MAFCKEAIFDALLNFLLITPLAVLFIIGTRVVVDQLISNQIGDPTNAAVVLLIVGAGVEFIVVYWQVK